MRHETRIRVRFDEVDAMRVVHHPRYLVYFEIARTELFRDLGVRYRDVMQSGTHLAVVEIGVRYLRPARYDDELTVESWFSDVGGASVLIRYRVRRDATVLATGFTRLGSIEDDGRAKRLPADLRECMAAACEPDGEDAPVPGVQAGA